MSLCSHGAWGPNIPKYQTPGRTHFERKREPLSDPLISKTGPLYGKLNIFEKRQLIPTSLAYFLPILLPTNINNTRNTLNIVNNQG